MEGKICILFSGIENLGGRIAIELVERFKLKKYGGLRAHHAGGFYYADFDPEITDFNGLTELFEWLGGYKINFRFCKSNLPDTVVDFQLHMVMSPKRITIPRPFYL